jgi:hypothetical protein
MYDGTNWKARHTSSFLLGIETSTGLVYTADSGHSVGDSITPTQILRVTPAGFMLLNETTNANMTIGITINQGAADDEILCFKSSDISHGAYGAEADTFGFIKKQDASEGGLSIRGYRDANTSDRGGLSLNSTVYGDVTTTQGSGGWKGSIELWALKASGAAETNQTADGVLVCMNTYNARGWVCNWNLDDNGDTWQFGDITSGEGQKVVRLDLDNSLGNFATEMVGRANRTTENDEILRIRGYWNANEVCRIDFLAGADTTNKDEGRMKFYVANGGAAALAIFVDRNKNTLFYGGLQVFRDVGATAAWMSVGYNRSASESARLDLIGDTTYTDYGLRIIRGSGGANAESNIIHRGTGDFTLVTDEAADIVMDVNSTEAWRLDSDGARNMALQPCFRAYGDTDLTNFTFNNNYTLVFNQERFDQSGDFNTGTYTFTAPVAGKYYFHAAVRFSSTLDASAQYYIVVIVTSNREYHSVLAPKWASDPNYHTVEVNCLADMDASDTAYVKIYQQGGASQTDVDHDERHTRFSGYLVA